ncbi:hypothetical protein GCM10022419_093320 [Nonomuraea rosea]|uniref:PQQ-binding-like beta-propeller repeat protein n=1 Tax=Nonomuraea rosea TaxID=638574 RepID=A0ABP6Z1Y6_9ACTN
MPGVPRELWRFKGGGVLRPPTLRDGLLVTVDAGGTAYGLDTANGMLSELRPLGAPAAADGLVYVIFQDLGEPSFPGDRPQAVLHAVGTATGAAVWSRPLDHDQYTEEVNPVLPGDGVLYVRTADCSIVALGA